MKDEPDGVAPLGQVSDAPRRFKRNAPFEESSDADSEGAKAPRHLSYDRHWRMNLGQTSDA